MDVGLGGPVHLRTMRFGPYPAVGMLGYALGATSYKVAAGWYRPARDFGAEFQKKFGYPIDSVWDPIIGNIARQIQQAMSRSDETAFEYNHGVADFIFEKGRIPSGYGTHKGEDAAVVDGANKRVADHVAAYHAAHPSVWESITNVVTAPARKGAEDVLKAVTGKDVTVTSISVSPKQLLQAVETAVSFVPGVGAGINAAIAAGTALASGENISDAFVDAAKNAIPGGPVAAAALDTAYKTVRAAASGQNIGDAALAAARDQIPGGDIAKRAFDVGIAIAHGQNVQEAIKSGVTNYAVSQLSSFALPPALMEASKILPPATTQVATAIFNRPELQNLPIADIAKALKVDQNTAGAALKAANDAAKADPMAVLARLTPEQQKALAAQTAMAQLGKLSPAQQKALVAYASLSKLSPEQQKALVAYASKKPPTLKEVPAKAKAPVVVASSTPKPAIPPRGAPKVATTQFKFGPYPKSAGTVSAPPPHGHGGGGHHGGGHHDSHRVFRGGKRIPGWGRWDGPWATEIVTTTATCQTWSDPVSIPASMQSAAKVAVGASQGQPTTLQGDDGRLYLISLERGVIVARVCAAFA